MKILVNLMTTIRFVYTLILPILKLKISQTAFVINIIILFLTDSWDGLLARKYKVQTLYGSVMDTVADKTLSIILLSILLMDRMGILSVVLLCEIIISIPNILGMATGKKTKSSIIGKIKMWLLSITIVLSYLNYFNIVNYNIVIVSSVITITMQLFAIYGYIKNLIIQKEIKQERKKIENIADLKYILFDTDYYMSLT